MDKLIKAIEHFAPVLLAYPKWAQGLFILTTVLLALSLAVFLILLPSAKKKSDAQAKVSTLSFVITKPEPGDFITTRRFSIYGKGAKPTENNTLKVQIINVQSGTSQTAQGHLIVNSDKSWRFDYLELDVPGPYDLVVDAIFGTTKSSKTLRINYEPDQVEVAAQNLLATVPEYIDQKIDEKVHESAREAMRQLMAAESLSGLSSEAETYYRMGNYFFIERQFDKAIEMYRKTTAVHPSHYKAYQNMAEALRELGQWQEALQAYQKARELEPGNTKAKVLSMHNLASAYRAMGRNADALEILQKIIELDPLYVHAYFSAGQVSEEMGKTSEAVNYYKQFLQVAKTTYPILYQEHEQELTSRISHLR